MFERFDDRARHVVVLAQEESRGLEHSEIGPVHLLLALARDDGSIGNRALASLGVTYDAAQAAAMEVLGSGHGQAATGHIPFTPSAKRTLDGALRAALRLGHRHVGTGHVLLGLLDAGDASLDRVLDLLHLDPDAVREEVFALDADYVGEVGESPSRLERLGPSADTPSSRCSFCDRDLATVAHYVQGPRGAICPSCAGEAVETIAHARITGGATRIDRAPTVHGAEPHPGAVAEIAEAVRHLIESDAEGAVERIEDGEAFGHRLAAVKAHHGKHSAIVDGVDFTAADEATVRFTILLSPSGGPVLDGTVVRRDGRWLVSRQLVTTLLRLGGER